MQTDNLPSCFAGGPEVLMGLTITLSCCLELPIFHYMGSILQFVGVQAMLHWVMLFFLVSLCFALLLMQENMIASILLAYMTIVKAFSLSERLAVYLYSHL